MRASDEWLVIFGGIGSVLLLFQIWHKTHKTGAYSPDEMSTPQVADSPGFTPSSVADSPGFTPSSSGQSMFSPAPEDITIGPTTIGGDSINMGSNLFPYFGYAVRNNGLNSVYSAMDKLMQNNAEYQNQQAQVNNNYDANASSTLSAESIYGNMMRG